MIENVLEIKDTRVREVMTPLVDVVAIDGSAKLIDFQKLWETHQYSRFGELLNYFTEFMHINASLISLCLRSQGACI